MSTVFFLALLYFANVTESSMYYEDDSKCFKSCYKDYHGSLSTTMSGKRCRRWRVEDLTRETEFNDRMQNYCRLANLKALPWCYVEGDDTDEWEYCFYFSCSYTFENRNAPNACRKTGYIEYEGNCYTILQQPVSSWANGILACTADESELVSLKSEKQANFIDSMNCLPKLVSNKHDGNGWNLAEKSPGTPSDSSEANWNWCRSDVAPSSGNCTSWTSGNCMEMVNCNAFYQPLYPACAYTPHATEYTVNVTNITWEKASEQCKADGRRLCSDHDLCNAERSYKSSVLPLRGDHWAPVGDEYNDWIYIGDKNSELPCQRHNKHFGPPYWGTDSSVCVERGSRHYVDLCEEIGKVLCCEIETPSPGKLMTKVPVYVRSRNETGTAYFHFSKNENLARSDIEKDYAPWRVCGREKGDVRMFMLWAGHVPDEGEDPIYFCTREAHTFSGYPTMLHSISLRPCKKSWTLNFYLYGRTSPLSTQGEEIYVLVTREGAGKTAHSRVSNTSVPLVDIKYFKLFMSSADEITMAEEAVNPCGDHIQKLKDNVGVISTPNLPSPYPKNTPHIECQWRVSTVKGNLMRITFTKIDLKKSVNGTFFVTGKKYRRFRTITGERIFNDNQECKSERVKITDPISRKDRPNWVQYGTFCGDWKPPPFVTTGNSTLITFSGSSSGKSLGFSLIYESVSPPRGLVQLPIEEEERVGMTWIKARRVCRRMHKDLCRTSDICGLGRPFYGVEREIQWTPVQEEYNDWAQIGEGKGLTCQRHNEQYGPPQWGVTEFACSDIKTSSPCVFKSILYCCNPWVPDGDELLNEEISPAKEVAVEVYTTVQNGRTFYRYIRVGIDSIDGNSIWTSVQRHSGDLTNIIFYSKYKSRFDKVVYFCFKPLDLAIGQMQTVYAMFSKPCHLQDWRLSFYLYAADSEVEEEETKRIYIGISTLQPYHSRACFLNFPPMFRGMDSFTIYAASTNFVPVDNGRGTGVANEESISTCNSTPITIFAPSILTSPGYPKTYEKSMNCIWRIRLSDVDMNLGIKLRITIEDLELEDKADILTIYEAPLSASIDQLPYREAKEYSGVIRSVTLNTNRSFLLQFESDYSIQRKGFKIIAEVISDKCGGLIRDHGATITSLNYPKKYRAGLNCSWSIKARNGYGVEVQFGKFELRDSENCSKDYVFVGGKTSSSRLCGVHNKPPRLQFNESVVSLNFVSAEGKISGHIGFIFNVFFWPLGNLGGAGVEAGQCGHQTVEPWLSADAAAERIVGGQESIAGSWPWVVHLPEASCGGALLNNRWVLTAGHCFASDQNNNGSWNMKMDASNYTVVAGRHHRTIKSRGEQVFEVERIVMHPKYKRQRLGNAGRSVRKGIPLYDLALVKLKQSAIQTNTTSPICLPRQDISVGETCVIAGWGAKELLASLSRDARDTLHYAHVHTLANSLCNTYQALMGSVTEKMICAGYPGGGVDSCSGDSGGPLMCKTLNGVYQIKGVVSWGRGCGKRNQPGIYTRVYAYYEWITSIIYT